MSGRVWWTPAELAAAKLPDLPHTKRRINALADRSGWRNDRAIYRRQGIRGGGWEYHRDVLPAAARAAILAREAAPAAPAPSLDRDAAWAAYETAPEAARAEAARRLAAIQQVEALTAAGTPATAATAHAARGAGVSARTLYNWTASVAGARADDRLAHLVPRTAQRGMSPARVAVDPDFAADLHRLYLRAGGQSLRACHDEAAKLAVARGTPVPTYKTVQRWLDREVSRPVRILARRGVDALRAAYPPQRRDKTALHAMEAVNGDVHRFDVFVRWPGGPGQPDQVIRPQMVAFQDVHSGMLVAWRVDRTPNAHTTKLAIGDMVERYGIPGHVTLDNGREFAAKEITGGAPNRYRFRVREDDMPGLLTQLGCQIHWAQPYSGQSKPIERAFRDLCDRVSKDIRLEGAYTGNSPTAKPENYGSRAVPLEEFLAVLAEGIEAHNLRRGRRSEVACGRSFAEVFEASYATAPIRKATEAQRRLWLMGAEGLRARTGTGEIVLMDNHYWAPWLSAHAGEKLMARFDVAALWDGVHVYDGAGRYLGHAPCQRKVGFYDVDEARLHAKARRDWTNAEKRALEALRRKTALEVGDALTAVAPEPAEPPEARVVTPIFTRRAEAAREPASSEAVEAVRSAIVEDLAARRSAPEPEAVDEERATFRRALELEAARAAGGITREQERWLAIYTQSASWRASKALHDDFGDAMFAGM